MGEKADPLYLLKAMMACASVTPAEAGALDLLETALAPLGFAVTRVTFEGDGSYPVDNLFAIRERGGKRLLFGGHTDVVPPGDAGDWSSAPFTPTEREGKLFGRGAADMKSGIAAFVGALAASIESGAADRGTIALAITGDEEADAVNGTAKLMDWAKGRGFGFDFALVGEPSSARTVGDSIKIGRRGSLSARVTVEGMQGHVAYPERARNPLPVLAAIATELSALRLDAGGERFPPSNLEVTSIDTGNRVSNMVPARGTLDFNVRFSDAFTPATLEARLRECVDGVEPNGCTVGFSVSGTPSSSFLSPDDGTVALLRDVIARRTGRPPELSTGGGTSDARFIARHCPVVELGIVGPSMHKADEHIEISDFRALTLLYADFLDAYFSDTA